MLNRELQESMNLPPFINTVGGLGEPLPARRGKDEERGKEGGRGEKEGEEGSGWCAGVGAVEEEQDGGRVWPGWSALASWSSAARVDGRPPDFRAFVSRSRDRARPMASAIFKSAPLF